MTEKQQAELISAACKRAGIDTHIRWIESKKQADTWAEKIAVRFKGDSILPVKNRCMYRVTLDMRFLYNQQGTPIMTYAGYVMAGCKDIAEGKLIKAFRKAEQVLNLMKKLAEEQAQI